MRFSLKFNINQARPLIEPVFKRIYQLTYDDIDLLNRWMAGTTVGNLYFDHTYQLKSDLVIRRIINTDNWIIEFDVDSRSTIVGVLPNVIGEIIFNGLSNDENEINERLYEFKRHYDGCEKVRHFDQYCIDVDKLEKAIVGLASKGNIKKYVKIKDVLFLVVYRNAPCYVMIENGCLKLKGIDGLCFDIDDGFMFGDKEVCDILNERYFNGWKAIGDMTLPVIPNIMV